MIDAKELRIGNVVSYQTHIVEVTELQHAQCTILSRDFSRNHGTFYSCIMSIPLTDEILSDWCGFNHSWCNYHHVFSLGNFRISNFGAGYLFSERVSPIDSLHELQNLYFSITKKELTINLPKQ